MSRLNAVLLISRCQRTSHATVSVSSALNPRRGPSLSAIFSPITEWSPPRPLAMSCSKVATYSARRETTVGMIELATGNSSFSPPVSTWCRMPIANSVCSSTVYTWYMSYCICATTRPKSGTNLPKTPASFMRLSAISGFFFAVRISRNRRLASGSWRVVSRQSGAATASPARSARGGCRDRAVARRGTAGSARPDPS